MPNEFYVTIVGQSQGRFKGDKEWGQENRLIGLGFDLTVMKHTDPGSGHATGRRLYQPVRLTRPWGESSPQLFQALVNNENLKSVVFEFTAANKQDGDMVYETIKLTNANFVGYRHLKLHEYMPSGVSGPKVSNEGPNEFLEEVTFTFEKIEFENKFKVMTSDVWGK